MNNEFALERRKVGEINIPNGLVNITDPSYKKEVWCRMNDVKVRPGKYDCFSFVGEIDDWGPRVWINQIVNQDIWKLDHQKMEKIDEIGVDSGLAGYLVEKQEFQRREWIRICVDIEEHDKKFPHPEFTQYRTYFTDGEDGHNGFFTQSGCGDGGYDVYAAKVGDEIVALEIRFLSEEEFEEIIPEED